ncbi:MULTISPECIES: acyl-CoA dehydrogenase family protein [Kitasatospora]|uniref:Putative acyl-CoA dehydrogenase n=1 Tax=Kitasatospora setae (strain ATCC 33774 / DSM 43861 / JCM 3304 / KCC A-0304 / NBRC 14216 / KM-6054) TaxID=452652 RepID=E4N9N5_KITSK|nr:MULTISPECIES: acyl-CoA dehydrogenase family protein [Kitasatospora]BAJ27916.1 putative acyl-CoA dehydrogenase [Kitasatospora setae KM-6054]
MHVPPDRTDRARALDAVIHDVVAPAAGEVDQTGAFPSAGIKALGEAGFLGLSVPVEDGGAGASAREFGETVTRLAEACASTAMVYVMHVTALSSFLAIPEAGRRRDHLRAILDNRWLVTEAISEPGSGSQWWSVSSTAEPTADGYRITADKSFATSAGHADLYVVSTRAPGATGDRDHAVFAVRADQGEITSGTWQGLGLAGNSSTWIRFRSEVGPEARLYAGTDGDGLRRYNEANQPVYHLGVSSAYLGIATAAHRAALGRIRSRRYTGDPAGFGARLGDYPVARRHVGENAIKIAGIRAMTADLARRVDRGQQLEELAVPMTACKVAAAEAASAVAREAMMASGGIAYSRGPLTIERHLRDALAASLMGPNDDFCKELIGRLEIDGTSYHDL